MRDICHKCIYNTIFVYVLPQTMDSIEIKEAISVLNQKQKGSIIDKESIIRLIKLNFQRYHFVKKALFFYE
jgi:hypothetical protein